jgi:Carboxypeptidase regulatory-like domain
MKQSLPIRAPLAVVLFLASVCALYGQAGSPLAQLNGTVHDPANATVPRAAITLRELDTNQVQSSTSNGFGFYVAPNLRPGEYELMVQAAGFTKLILSGIVLRVGQVATINVGLTIETHEEAILVTSETPVIEPSRTEASQVIASGQISSLPISGRLFTDFVLLTPGVSTGRTSLQSTNTEFEVTRVSFGGMRDLSNEVTVDGADTINTVTGSQRATPPQEAVSEFRVLNNSFGVGYGRALGGIVNIVTKSGGNTMHGAVYDYFQNDAVDAASLLSAPQFKTLRQNQFGAALGGAIVPDKTFYFANYEGQRRAESPTYPGYLLQDLPVIDRAKAALGLSPENLNILRTTDHDNGIIRVDHQLGASSRLAIRYDIEDGRDTNLLVGHTMDGGGVGAPSAAHNLNLRDQDLSGTWTGNLRNNFVNAALVQWARRTYNFPGVFGEPDLDVPNLLQFGHNFGVFERIQETRQQFSDSVFWVKGAHAMTFGADVNFLQDSVLRPSFVPMRIVLPGVDCLVQFANFVRPNANVPGNTGDPPCPLPPFLNGTPIIFWGNAVGTGPITPGMLAPALPTNWRYPYLPSQVADL